MFSALLADARTFLTLSFLSIILIILDNFNFLNFPKSLIQQITLPIQYGLYKNSLNVTRQFEFIILSRRASQENKALTEQLANIISENANLRKQLAEFKSLNDQQNTLGETTFNQISARPVGISRYLLIDKGSEDGIKINQAVVYKDNFIGLIKEVSPKRSKVILPTDPDSHINAFSGNSDSRAKGVLVGQFGAEMLLDKILHQEQIKVGDLVYSEGTEIEIPRGLILGQVSEVLSQDNEVFKQAKVKQIFSATNLELVFIITN